ncbi:MULTISPECIES: arabinose isomerase [Acidobacteriaceae]|uniref:arabinose isomerase n=1 Tax=Acidobacteriaceae TaxID=204434 RepID=UPI00131A69DA|nr:MULTISPECIES: arabinose isomerase [Acidobacteriaceae]MDW5264686.1 arabinose isomerase [Edaphobacter sp.]
MQSGRPLRVGLCGIGLDTYWPQFTGLRQRLEGYVAQVGARFARAGVEVVNLGMVDSPEHSHEAGHQCRREDIDILFLYVTTYALSSTVLPLVQRAGVPVVVLNLQPEAAIDYKAFNKLDDRTKMTGEWLAYCSACPVPEIANVMARARIPFHQVTGVLDDEETWGEIEGWVAAAQVRATLSSARLGLMGHYYNGMLDIMTDVTLVSIVFGTHLEIVEVDELSALESEVGEATLARRLEEFFVYFDVQPDCAPEELRRAARTSAALDVFVERHKLDALAYYYMGSGNAANEDTMSSIILGSSLLTARHIPVAGEYEVKNALAMKIMDVLGAGGSFTEYYAMDFNDDLVLMGHDGPGHIAISEGKTKVRPLKVYHGKVGRGLSVEMSVKHGPVTLLSVVEDAESRFKLLVAEGECVAGEILEIGNTNSRYRFSVGARGFVNAWNAQGPAHHCAVGVGHVAATLKKTAELIGIGFHQVC